MTKLIEHIEKCLKRDGLAYVKDCGIDAFHQISKELGTLLYTTDIKLDNRKSNVVYNPGEILFHTDYPKAQIVGWVCINSNDNEAPLELLDTNNLEGLADKVIKELSEVEVLFKCKLTSKINSIPLVIYDGVKIETTYNPWGIQSGIAENALTIFYSYLEQCRQITIALNKGDALFIDNHRLLHGRKSISSDSKRHLIRHFIKTRELSELVEVGAIN